MLIAIAGPQGSGKSTVVKHLEAKDYVVVETKFSRSILKEWNVTLEEVNDDYELSMKFQEELIERKWKIEKHYINNNEICFAERTYMDSFIYTLINFGKNNQYSKWLNDYYLQCLYRTQKYQLVFYIKGGLFQVEHDGVRGSNHHYARMVDNLLLDSLKQAVHPSKLSIIDYSDLTQRILTIEHQTNSLLTLPL